MEMNDMLLKQLECPMCFEVSRPPIYMCKNGHNLCSVCKQRVSACPVCREQGSPGNRNLLAEALTTQVRVPCRYAGDGCDVKVTFDLLDAHHQECDHRYVCLKCEWTGKLGELLDHVKRIHADAVCVKDKSFLFNVDVGKEVSELKLVYCDSGLFWATMRYSVHDAMFYLYAQYVGKNQNAEQYNAEFKIWTSDSKFSLSCVRPVLTKDDNYVTHRNTIKLNIATVQMLSQDNMILHYSHAIKTKQRESRVNY